MMTDGTGVGITEAAWRMDSDAMTLSAVT